MWLIEFGATVSFAFVIAGFLTLSAASTDKRKVLGSIFLLIGLGIYLFTQQHQAYAFNTEAISEDGSDPPGSFADPTSVLAYLERSLGALLMAISIIACIFTGGFAFGRRSVKAGLISVTCLLVAVGFFLLRSFQTTFKPVIYLYPQHTMDVSVKLNYTGTLTSTYPAYRKQLTGWNVQAQPSGTLTDLSDGKEYSYLFWEGILPDGSYHMPERGFVVSGEESAVFLQGLLANVGLLPREYNELIVYWYPQIKDYPYVQIAIAGPEYVETAPLEITPKPDSKLRVFMYFRRLSEPKALEPQTILPFERKGFTMVEWGGTLLP
jgi:hypothetical protein